MPSPVDERGFLKLLPKGRNRSMVTGSSWTIDLERVSDIIDKNRNPNWNRRKTLGLRQVRNVSVTRCYHHEPFREPGR